MIDHSTEQQDLLEYFRQLEASLTLPAQSQSQLKNYMIRERGTFDTVAPKERAHMVRVCQPMLKSINVQERISFKISSRNSALGMYQPPWKDEAEAQRRTASSTTGRGPRESRH